MSEDVAFSKTGSPIVCVVDHVTVRFVHIIRTENYFSALHRKESSHTFILIVSNSCLEYACPSFCS